MNDVIEVVVFRLNEGVNELEFTAASESVNHWVKDQPGFRYRSLSKDADGLWRDTVYWDSMANAKNAGEAFMRDLCQSDFMRMINETSVVMTHSEVQQAVAGAC